MKKNLLKRTSLSKLIAVVLATLMLVTALPLSVFAVPPPYREGTLLLHLDAMDSKTLTYNPYGVRVSTMSDMDDAKRDPDDSTRILVKKNTEKKAPRGGLGLKTNLPLDGTTAYTIEYYAKLSDRDNGMGMFMGFCLNEALTYPFYGVDMYAYSSGKKVTTHNKWWVDGYYQQQNTGSYSGVTFEEDFWVTKADEDGFVRFVLTFDGRYMGLSIGGEDIGVKYDLNRPRGKDFLKLDDWVVDTLNLEAGFAYFTQSAITDPEVNSCALELKDISIYSGVVDPDEVPEVEEPEFRKFVIYENMAGEEVGYTEILDGSLTLETEPETDLTNVWHWYDKETGREIQFPATFTEQTTLVGHQEFLTYEDGSGKIVKTETIPVDGLTLETVPDVGLTNVWDWYEKTTGKWVNFPATFTESTALVTHQEFVYFEDADGNLLKTYEIPVGGKKFDAYPTFESCKDVWGWTDKATGKDVPVTTTFTGTTALVAHQEFLILENSAGMEVMKYTIPPVDGLKMYGLPDFGLVNFKGWYNKETGEKVKAPATFTEATTLIARQEFDENGPLLLQLAGMDANSVTYQREGANAVQNYSSGINKGTLSTYVANATGANNSWGGYGVLTDLPLVNTEDPENIKYYSYTVEFYARMNGKTGLYAGFTNDLKSPNKTAGVRVHMNGDVKNYYTGMDVYNQPGTTNPYGKNIGDIWTARSDDDGYVRFVLTINEGILSLKVGDTVVPTTWDLNSVANPAAAKLSDFKTQTLAFCVGFSGYNGTGVVKPTNGTEVLDIKDISIYEGVVENTEKMPQFRYVTYENEKGAVLRKDLFDEENGYITVASFPETTAKMDAIWVDKATGIVVIPPMEGDEPLTITEPATFVVTEKGANASDVVAIQYSEAEDGTQSIRFIGSIYNLNCVGVGFDITVRYRNEDGEFVEAFYRLSGTAVYDSINATESGTMTNCYATDLGAYYIFGAVLEGVPTDIGQIDFEVTSFKVLGKLAVRLSGGTMTVSFKNGVINSTLEPLA